MADTGELRRFGRDSPLVVEALEDMVEVEKERKEGNRGLRGETERMVCWRSKVAAVADRTEAKVRPRQGLLRVLSMPIGDAEEEMRRGFSLSSEVDLNIHCTPLWCVRVRVRLIQKKQ